jgi:hypothetical protein
MNIYTLVAADMAVNVLVLWAAWAWFNSKGNGDA